MKKLLDIRLLALVGATLLLPAFASAAADMYLKIDGVKGESKIVPCPNGACVVDGLAPGKYTVQVCDAKGKVVPTDIALEYSVVSPRDAASGLPTGKRQHKPIAVSKAAGAKPTGEIVVTDAGSKVAIQVAAGSAKAAPAQDHNSSRSNKSGN